MTSLQQDHALTGLRTALAQAQGDPQLSDMIEARDEVLATYQPLFTRGRIPSLTAEEFRDFLMFRNNRHWTGLQRMGPAVTADMDQLREALIELLDEDVPVATRLDRLLPAGRARVPRLGKAILTAILLIARPDTYSVWNGTVEGAMRQLGVWPEVAQGTTLGHQYEAQRQVQLRLAQELGVDLWMLDALWWAVTLPRTGGDAEEEELVELEVEEEQVGHRFGLERHLQDFLVDNWDRLPLGKEWRLDEHGGDIKGYGYERPTPVGRMDLLARHRTEPRWLVVELKRNQTSDETIGQVMRYMGWVAEHLAEPAESVEGLVIAPAKDAKLDYALRMASKIRFQRYEVDFRLLD